MSDTLDPSERRSRGSAALERLDQRIKEIKRAQVRFTVIVLVGNAVWYGLLLAWFRDAQRANYVFTNSFQFLAVAWCCWFMLPYFLRVEAKQDVGIAMGHDSVDILEKVNDSIDKRIQKIDQVLDGLDRLVADLSGERHPFVKKLHTLADHLEEDIGAIRARIERDTAPIKPKRRPEQYEEDEAPGNGRSGNEIGQVARGEDDPLGT